MHPSPPNARQGSFLLSPRGQYLPYLCFCLLLCLSAPFLSSPREIYHGLWSILRAPGVLVTDYLLIAGHGAACLNAGLMGLLSILTLSLWKVPMNAAARAAIFTLTGFSFFGKNLFNSLPIMLGVYLYAKFMRQDFRQHILISLFATALAPMVSSTAFLLRELRGWELSLPGRLFTAYAVGLGIGFLMPVLASVFVRFHQGYNLYNAGFTAGLLAMVAAALLHYLGLRIPEVSLVDQGDSSWALILLGLSFALFIGLACYLERDWRQLGRDYYQLLRDSGRLVTDFAQRYGLAVTYLNVGLNGLLVTLIALLMGSSLSGPVIGGILCVTGFSAFGKHPRNCLPVISGVCLLNLLAGREISATLAVTTALFGTTLAPISGQYGSLAGILAGACHMGLILKVGVLHSGMNLYNNGFSGGFIAAILAPLLDQFQQSRFSFFRLILGQHRPREITDDRWSSSRPLIQTAKKMAPPAEVDKSEELTQKQTRRARQAKGLGSDVTAQDYDRWKTQVRSKPQLQSPPLAADQIHERETLANIAGELIAYFQYHEIEDYDLSLRREDERSVLRISGDCPLEPPNLRQLHQNLNRGRDRSLEGYYEQLLSIYDEGDEMPLLSVMIDGARVRYAHGRLEIEVWRQL